MDKHVCSVAVCDRPAWARGFVVPTTSAGGRPGTLETHQYARCGIAMVSAQWKTATECARPRASATRTTGGSARTVIPVRPRSRPTGPGSVRSPTATGERLAADLPHALREAKEGS